MRKMLQMGEGGRREQKMIAHWNKCAPWENYKCLKTGVYNESAFSSIAIASLFWGENTINYPIKSKELDLIRWVVY